MLASGDDKGEFKIWDLRMINSNGNGKNQELNSITKIRWHTQAITSIQFEPREESVLAVASADNKLTMWDFSVEMEDTELQAQYKELEANGMEIPPQLMFLHQGQTNMKELRFHPQYRSLLLTTAEDSFNIFRPNLDPEYEEEEPSTAVEESKTDEPITKADDFSLDSNEDMEQEEDRIKRTAKQLNKTRKARSKSKLKRRRIN